LLPSLVNRLRFLARIEMSAGGLQMGEFKLTVGNAEHAVRVYIIPTPRGPAVVLRLADLPDPSQRTSWRILADEWLQIAQAAAGSDPQSIQVCRCLQADSA
jgi:hypothetical protein